MSSYDEGTIGADTRTVVPDTPPSSAGSLVEGKMSEFIQDQLLGEGAWLPSDTPISYVDDGFSIFRESHRAELEVPTIRALVHSFRTMNLDEHCKGAVLMRRWRSEGNDPWSPLNLRSPGYAKLDDTLNLAGKVLSYSSLIREHKGYEHQALFPSAGTEFLPIEAVYDQDPSSAVAITSGRSERHGNTESSVAGFSLHALENRRRGREEDQSLLRVAKKQQMAELPSNQYMACWHFRKSPCENLDCLKKNWRYISKALCHLRDLHGISICEACNSVCRKGESGFEAHKRVHDPCRNGVRRHDAQRRWERVFNVVFPDWEDPLPSWIWRSEIEEMEWFAEAVLRQRAARSAEENARANAPPTRDRLPSAFSLPQLSSVEIVSTPSIVEDLTSSGTSYLEDTQANSPAFIHSSAPSTTSHPSLSISELLSPIERSQTLANGVNPNDTVAPSDLDLAHGHTLTINPASANLNTLASTENDLFTSTGMDRPHFMDNATIQPDTRDERIQTLERMIQEMASIYNNEVENNRQQRSNLARIFILQSTLQETSPARFQQAWNSVLPGPSFPSATLEDENEIQPSHSDNMPFLSTELDSIFDDLNYLPNTESSGPSDISRPKI